MDRTVKQLSTPPRRRPARIAAALVLASLAGASAAAPRAERHQALEDIRLAVADFLMTHHGPGEHLRVEAGKLDRRLRLARCERPLVARWAAGSAHVGRVTVEVRCEGARPWRLYVPSKVSVMHPVVVAARPLARGQRLGPGDLRVERRDLAVVGEDAVRDPARIRGYVLTRPLGTGRVLETRLLEAPRLVDRGQRVRLVAEGAGIHISMTGVAMEAGALGETVRVRNPASRRVVDAVVTGPGKVSLLVPRLASRSSRNQ